MLIVLNFGAFSIFWFLWIHFPSVFLGYSMLDLLFLDLGGPKPSQ